MNDIESLRGRISGGARRKPKKEEWKPPVLSDFYFGRMILALDPSLNNTGWVYFGIVKNGDGTLSVQVVDRGTLRPKTDADGFIGTWQKARELGSLLDYLIYYEANSAAYVAFETPSVGGGHRTESSLIAGYLAYERIAASKRRPVAAQHASSILCGNARHDKGEIKKSVARYIPESAGRSWNEHQRDAVAIGLAFLYDLNLDVAEKRKRNGGKRAGTQADPAGPGGE